MPQRNARARALENQRFLAALRRTGNVRAAVREIGAHRATFFKRRARDPALAQAWDAALAVAHAALAAGPRRPTDSAEPRACNQRGRLQLRRAQPGRLDRAGEQRFLLALAATANVRLAAQAAGFSHSAFYHRRRTSPAFAREFREAMMQGYERVEMALLASALPSSHHDDAWRHNDPPALPPMTTEAGIMLLVHHHRLAKLLEEPGTIQKRVGESWEMYRFRVGEMMAVRKQRERDRYTIAEAERQARDGLEAGEAPIVLPDLGVVGR